MQPPYPQLLSTQAEAWAGFSLSGDPEKMYVKLLFNKPSAVALTQAEVNVVLDQFGTHLRGLLPATYAIGGGHIYDGTLTTPVRVDQTSAAQAGLGAGGALPQNCALLVRHNVSFGRRGRSYIPGAIPEGNVNDAGVLTAAWLTTCQTQLDALHAGLIATTPVLSIAKWVYQNPNWTTSLVTSFSVQPVIATMRRRLRK